MGKKWTLKFLANGKEVDAELFSDYSHFSSTYPSIYEVLRIENWIPLFIEDYMERLCNSMQLLNKPLFVSTQKIEDEIYSLIKINRATHGPVKLVFGTGEKQFFHAWLMKPNLPEPEEYITGVKTIMMHTERFNPNIKVWNEELRNKSIDLLRRQHAYEAILVNKEGFITEASRSDVFFVSGGKLFTTPSDMVLPGITRKKVVEVCLGHGIDVIYKKIHMNDLSSYDSCFLTGTARKIVPVKNIDKHSFDPGSELINKVSKLFERHVNEYIEKILNHHT